MLFVVETRSLSIDVARNPEFTFSQSVCCVGPTRFRTVNIETGDTIAGSLPTAVLKEVRRWLDSNRDSALKLWKERNPNL